MAANEKRFLNSGGFVGFASQLFSVVSHEDLRPSDDDQLYYTKIFLDPHLRVRLAAVNHRLHFLCELSHSFMCLLLLRLQQKWGMVLDTRSEIFQNLNGALDDVQLKFKESQSYLYNTKTASIPIVVHGNGPIKVGTRVSARQILLLFLVCVHSICLLSLQVQFNSLTNYLVDSWTPEAGCLSCAKNLIELPADESVCRM